MASRTLGHQPPWAEGGWFGSTWVARGYMRLIYSHRQVAWRMQQAAPAWGCLPCRRSRPAASARVHRLLPAPEALAFCFSLAFCRSDVVAVKIGRSHWRELHSQWRWWDSMFCMVGPVSRQRSHTCVQGPTRVMLQGLGPTSTAPIAAACET